MKNTIKFLFFTILLCAVPALQAMGALRNFASHTFNMLASQQYNHKIYSNVGYKLTTATAATLAGGYLWNIYNTETSPKLSRHNYDAPIPTDLKKILDTQFEVNKEQPNLGCLPGWMIKPGHNRIEGAKKFSQAIHELGYTNFIVPQKYRYTSASGNDYTISKVIIPTEEKITKEEFKQLYKLAQKLHWTDSHGGNFLKTKENEIALIDTKTWYINVPFSETGVSDEDVLKWRILLKLRKGSLRHFDNEALEYLALTKDQYNPYNEQFFANSENRKLRKFYKEFFNRFGSL